jgi:hypothetical protein
VTVEDFWIPVFDAKDTVKRTRLFEAWQKEYIKLHPEVLLLLRKSDSLVVACWYHTVCQLYCADSVGCSLAWSARCNECAKFGFSSDELQVKGKPEAIQ